MFVFRSCRIVGFALFLACGSFVAGAELSFTPLFDGSSLDQWQADKNPDCWTVADGVLHVKNDAKRKGSILNTKKSYRDFVCELDFKFGSGNIDSGVFLRNNKEQIQIGISGSLKRDMTASPYIPGKGYPVEAKAVKKLLKMQDWNTLRIRAIGNVYTTWLNGREVMNYASTSAIKEGPIGLQLHPSRTMTMQFRNLRIAELVGAKAPQVPVLPEPKKGRKPAGADKQSKLKTATGLSLVKGVTSSTSEAGNPAEHILDADPTTRWAANGKNEWVELALSKEVEVSQAAIGFTKGQGRHYHVRIDGSADGKQWDRLFDGKSDGRGDKAQTFLFERTMKVAFLKLTSFGNNKNNWINIHTLRVPGAHEGRAAIIAAKSPKKKSNDKNAKPETAGALSIDLWAENPLVASPVGIGFDEKGRAYVTRVRRRKRSSKDLRQNRGWVKDDLSFQSIDDRLAFYKKNAQGVADFNGDGKKDWQDLAGEKEEILMVEDTDGDGKADKKTLIDSLGSPVTGIAASTLWHNGELYAAVEPDIWKWRDSDGDGVVDKRQLLATGFSIHIGQGGHNTSGLAVGFDGRIYWSVADKGINATGSDGSRVFLPNRGGVMRCEPDGSKLEVFAPGVRNGQELAFDEFGNLFTVDNDGDYKGERERFLYLIEGGQIGWRLNWQWFGVQDFAKVSGERPYNVWMEEKLFKTRWDGQAAWIVPPVANYSNGPCGFKYNPGTAINTAYRNHFFFAQGKALHAFKVEPDGGSFKMTNEHQITKGPWNTGLAFGPDGALYVCDWMSGPSERGRVWRVDDPTQVSDPLRLETKEILRSGMGKRSTDELGELLGHADLRVRREAQFALVAKGQADALLLAVKQKNQRLARLHGIWGLGQLGRKKADAVAPLLPFFQDSDLQVRAHAAKVVGEAAYAPGLSGLIALLDDSEIRVRSFAAVALRHFGAASAVQPLLAAAVSNADKDAYLRHAIVMGLSTADSATLAAVSSHASASARLVALLALRRQASPAIAVYVKDADPYIVTEVARAIHDDLSIPEALPALASSLERIDIGGEPFLRRAINANFRVGGAANAERLARYAARAEVPENMKTTALACLALWPQPPVLDAVEGRYRKHAPRDSAVAAAALGQVAAELGNAESDKVRMVLAQAIQRLKSVELLPLVHAMYESDRASSVLRGHLLDTMNALVDPKLGGYVKAALAGEDAKLRSTARKYAAAAGMSGIELAERALATGTLLEKRAALSNLAESADAKADVVLGKWLLKLTAGKVADDLGLDVYLAARARPSLAEKIKAYDAKQAVSGPLGTYGLVYAGGDIKAGKRVAQGHPAAQCIRCHMINKAGGILGPDLTIVASRLNAEKLLESLIVPSAEVSEGFGMLIATTKAGKSVSGTVSKETPEAFEVKAPDGTSVMLKKSDIANHQLVSAMPPMGAILSLSEIRDLMAYLRTLK